MSSKWLQFSPILLVIGGIIMITGQGGTTPGPGPSPDNGDVLSVCHVADRASQVKILREAATMPATSADEKRAVVKWINEKRVPQRTEDYIPYTDAVGVAINNGTLATFADTLDASK